MVIARDGQEIELRLASPEELFVGPAPGVRPLVRDGQMTWDRVGAVLGEPGVDRLLRLAHANPDATSVSIGFDAANGPAGAEDVRASHERLRTWLVCRSAANAEQIRTLRRIGLRSTLFCLLLLAGALLVSWVLQSEQVLGQAGPLRTLLAEALIIAGWVVMWRPLEMLMFEPLRFRYENRLIARVLAMRWKAE